MATLKEPFALDRSLNTTELTPRNIADVLAEGLSHITGRTASEVEYDNSESGLTSDDVQGAIDELSERPTLPTTDIQTAVDEFETYNGGLLSECKVALSPNQDLHGYDSPWVGGAGKNKLPLVLADIKSVNTSGTWSGNVYTISGTTFEVMTDDADNVTGIKINGTSSGGINFNLADGVSVPLNDSYKFFGCDSFSSGVGAITYSFSGASDVNVYKNAVTSTISGTFTHAHIYLWSGKTFNNVMVYPMFMLASESDDSFAPYSNICPISGHTQVEVDVSDGQTTQEQVTVNLGGTYYSGTLDVVSGVLTVDTVAKTYNGTENWVASNNGYYLNVPLSDAKASALAISNLYKYNATTWTSGCFGITASKTLWVGNTNLLSVISANNLFVVYELATPTPIQLSPTMVKALVGENHLDAPLEGQEITESKYKQMFTFDDVIAYIQSLS